MLKKWLLFSISAVFLILLQTGFISGLPLCLKTLNLVVVSLVVIISVFGFEMASWWVIAAGFLLDIFSFTVFGVNIISLIFALIITEFLLVNFFTNRSLYSYLALTFIASFSYRFSILFLYYLTISSFEQKIIFNFNLSMLKYELCGFGMNLILIFIVFYIINFLSRSLRPVFIRK